MLSSTSKIDLLALRRKTQISHILDKVPKPKRAIPINAPAEWQKLSLDALIPMYKFPAKTTVFSRNKIGKEIYSSAGNDFDLSDPYCQTVSFDYNPLHDHCLKSFYQRDGYIKHFIENGSITDTHEVRCTLKQFNEYRRFLKRLYLNDVNRERGRHDEYHMDRRRFEFIEKLTRKFRQTCQRREVVLEKRKRFEQEMANEAENRKKKFANLMEKYRATIDRFEEIKRNKQLEVKHKSYLKEFYARERRAQLKQHEKRRTILLKRKFVVEGQLVKRRMRSLLAKKSQRKNDKTKAAWDSKVIWSAQKELQNRHIMALCEENMGYNIMRRNQLIAAKYEEDLQHITEKRRDFIRSRYQQRTPTNIAHILAKEIDRFIKRIEKISRSRSECSNFTRSEHSKSTNTRLTQSEHSKSTNSRLTQSEPVVQSVSNEMVSKKSSEMFSKESSEMVSKESMNTEEVTFVEQPSTIQVRQSALFLPVELSEAGLGDYASGYNKVSVNDVALAVNTSFYRMRRINGSITTMQVLEDATLNLKRISKGYIFDIPRDEGVIQCVQNAVTKIFETVVADQMAVLNSTPPQKDKPQKKKKKIETIKQEQFAQDTLNKEKRIQFGQTFIINQSAYADDIDMVQSCQGRPSTPVTPIQNEAHTILLACEGPDDEDISIPEEIQALEHLYDFQKIIILKNLERLRGDLSIKIQHAIEQWERKGKMQENKDFVVIADEHANMVEMIVESVLTLPEKDAAYGDRLMTARNYLTKTILHTCD